MPHSTLFTVLLRKLVHLEYKNILQHLEPLRLNCKSEPIFLYDLAHFLAFVLIVINQSFEED